MEKANPFLPLTFRACNGYVLRNLGLGRGGPSLFFGYFGLSLGTLVLAGSLLRIETRWAVSNSGHFGSILGNWLLTRFTFVGWERVGHLLGSCHVLKAYLRNPWLPHFCLPSGVVTRGAVDVTLDFYSSHRT